MQKDTVLAVVRMGVKWETLEKQSVELSLIYSAVRDFLKNQNSTPFEDWPVQ